MEISISAESKLCRLNRRGGGGGHFAFVADPVGVPYCLNEWILTTLVPTHYWEVGEGGGE